ncbi:MAG: hypothetical protein R3B51_02320 [Thermodesulfobacteriota bacterium]
MARFGPYVDAVTGPLLSGFEGEEPPLLILEPGRAVVGCTTRRYCRLVEGNSGRKASRRDRRGVNLLPTSFWRHQTVELIGNPEGEPKETIV